MADMSAEASAKTLWMGDLAYWMDETFVYSVFVGEAPFVDPHGAIVPGFFVPRFWCRCPVLYKIGTRLLVGPRMSSFPAVGAVHSAFLVKLCCPAGAFWCICVLKRSVCCRNWPACEREDNKEQEHGSVGGVRVRGVCNARGCGAGVADFQRLPHTQHRPNLSTQLGSVWRWQGHHRRYCSMLCEGGCLAGFPPFVCT